jgi:hypothetical protein
MVPLMLLALLMAGAPRAAAAAPRRGASAPHATLRDDGAPGERPAPPLARRAPRHGLRAETRADGDGTLHATLRLRGRDRAAAVANFSDGAAAPSGFGQLRVWSDPGLPANVQFYAAGYAEVRGVRGSAAAARQQARGAGAGRLLHAAARWRRSRRRSRRPPASHLALPFARPSRAC